MRVVNKNLEGLAQGCRSQISEEQEQKFGAKGRQVFKLDQTVFSNHQNCPEFSGEAVARTRVSDSLEAKAKLLEGNVHGASAVLLNKSNWLSSMSHTVYIYVIIFVKSAYVKICLCFSISETWFF